MQYDKDTAQFMKDAADGPLNKPPTSVSTAVGSMPQPLDTGDGELQATMPTRDPYPRPTAPQSVDNQQGSVPSGASGIPYPTSTKLGTSDYVAQQSQSEEATPFAYSAKDYLKTLSRVHAGGNPVAVVARTLAAKGVKDFITPESMKKTSAEKMLGALSFYNSLNTMYGKDWHDWEIDTILQTVLADHKIDLGADTVSEIRDILGALQVILNTNFAHEEWHVFEKVGHAFNLGHVDFSTIQPLDIHEVALTLDVMNKIRPKTTFSNDIIGYIAASAKHSGLTYLPESFFPKGSQEALDSLGNDITLKAAVEQALKSRTPGHTEAEILQIQRLTELVNYVKQFER